MLAFQRIFVFFVLFSLFLIVLFISSMNNDYSKSNLKKDILLSKQLEQKRQKNLDAFNLQYVNLNDINYCAKEWVVLNKTLFFKKSAAFLFLDVKHTFIYFVSKFKLKKNLNLKLVIFQANETQKLTEIYLKNVLSYKYKVFDNKGPYSLYALKANFDCDRLQLYGKSNEFTIEAFPYLSKKQITYEPLVLKIKKLYGDDKFKKNAMICSKIAYMNGNTYKDLEWWIQLNKKIGFDKIVLYNNSIENDPNFNYLFNKYGSFVQVKQLQCFPDVINYTDNYIRKINDLVFDLKYGRGYRRLWDFFHVLVYNECYLENIDKYKYISNIDSDELIIPRLQYGFFPSKENSILIDSEKFQTFSNFKQFQDPLPTTNLLADYSNNLKDFLNFNDSKSIYFKNVYYMPNYLIRQILDKFRILNNKANYFREPYSIFINNLTTNFTISTQEEHDYAIYLTNIYNKILMPFYEKNKLLEFPESYNRFFFLANNKTLLVRGKNLFSTKTALHLTAHLHLNDYYSNYYHVLSKYGHLSHFRDKSSFQITNQTLSISDIWFDLNYFKYYFIDNLEDNSRMFSN